MLLELDNIEAVPEPSLELMLPVSLACVFFLARQRR